MRLYKITALNISKGDARNLDITWVGSQADAAAKRKLLAAEGFTRKEIKTEEIDVPTDKAGLMAFLIKVRSAS